MRECAAHARAGRVSAFGPRRARVAALLPLLLLVVAKGCVGSPSLGAGSVCARAAGLTGKQRALCRANPPAMPIIASALRAAFAECRTQLAGRRWNCSGVGEANPFNHVMPLATREAAYTYALASASVTHALSAACARGDLPACSCAHSVRRRESPGWEWAGARCGQAAWGARLARRFLDAREEERDARAHMNLHNNRLGRKLVKEGSRRECACHGVSGSCALRTCWRALPSPRALAATLTGKLARARLVALSPRPAPGARARQLLVVKRQRPSGEAVLGRAARRSELVYLQPSPSYCDPDPARGVLGTRGRLCNATASGEGGCGVLCCGRGHETRRVSRATQCRCRFIWCCRVTCDSCVVSTEEHTCL